MHKKTLKDVNVSGRRVLVRVDYNVPIDDFGKVRNDKRLRATLPTINYLIKEGARVILLTHLGRPAGEVVEHLRTTDIARALSELLEKEVKKIDECIGSTVKSAVSEMKEGDVLLLENVRFHKEEKNNDPLFSKKLSENADIFVNDGFGVSHRNQASITGVTAFLPSVAGILVENEVRALTKVRDNPEVPLVVVMGGVKLKTRIPMIEHFVKKADKIIFGGAMIFTFLKAQGKEVGTSLVDDSFLGAAKDLLDKYADSFVLPTDVVIASSLDDGVEVDIVSVNNIPPDKMGLDIGPDTVRHFIRACEGAKTLIWNGPLGAFETIPFNKGTEHFAKEIIKLSIRVVVGGGDTAAALEFAGLAEKMDFVSTGGGASLLLLEGGSLPGVEALDDA